MKTWFEKEVEKIKGKQYEFDKALLDFTEALAINIKPMPIEFEQTVEKHFWEMLGK